MNLIFLSTSDYFYVYLDIFLMGFHLSGLDKGEGGGGWGGGGQRVRMKESIKSSKWTMRKWRIRCSWLSWDLPQVGVATSKSEPDRGRLIHLHRWTSGNGAAHGRAEQSPAGAPPFLFVTPPLLPSPPSPGEISVPHIDF